MIKGWKKYALLAGVSAMAAASLLGCGKAKEIDGTAAAAVCNEEEIPMGVASLYTRYQQAQMYSFYTQYFGMTELFDTVYDEESGETYGDSMKNDMMDSLKELYVLKQNAGDFGVEISEENQTAIAAAAKQFMEENDAEKLKEMGVSESDVAALLELYTYQTLMREAMIADVDRNVSDEEAARTSLSYVRVSLSGTTDDDGNTVELTDDEIAEKEELMQQVLDEALASDNVAEADLSAIAEGISEDLYASTLKFGTNDEEDTTDSAIKEAVAGLEDGTMVDHVVTTTSGDYMYVIRLDAAFDEEATEAKKLLIISDREDEHYEEELAEMVEAADFEIVEDVWDLLEITDSQVYTFKTEEAAEETTDETTEDTAEETTDDTADDAASEDASDEAEE